MSNKAVYPRNPEVCGYHWLRGKNGPYVLRWADGKWGGYPGSTPEEMAEYGVVYIEPCVLGQAAVGEKE
jgi:hypothetical protein